MSIKLLRPDDTPINGGNPYARINIQLSIQVTDPSQQPFRRLPMRSHTFFLTTKWSLGAEEWTMMDDLMINSAVVRWKTFSSSTPTVPISFSSFSYRHPSNAWCSETMVPIMSSSPRRTTAPARAIGWRYLSVIKHTRFSPSDFAITSHFINFAMHICMTQMDTIPLA